MQKATHDTLKLQFLESHCSLFEVCQDIYLSDTGMFPKKKKEILLMKENRLHLQRV